MFSVRYRRIASAAFDIWHKEYMGLGKCTGWPFHDLDPRSRLWHRLAKICLCQKVRTIHRITTKHGSFVALVIVITWLDFGEILLKTVILVNFLKKFWMCFFKVKYYLGHISGMVSSIDVKRKASALVGYWVQYMTLTFDLTHDLDLGCFKVKFQNSSISGTVGLIDAKWKGSELIWYWANCMTMPFEFQG